MTVFNLLELTFYVDFLKFNFSQPDSSEIKAKGYFGNKEKEKQSTFKLKYKKTYHCWLVGKKTILNPHSLDY